MGHSHTVVNNRNKNNLYYYYSTMTIVALRLTPTRPLYHLLESANSVCNAGEKTNNVPSFLNVYLKVFKQNTCLQRYKLRSHGQKTV